MIYLILVPTDFEQSNSSTSLHDGEQHNYPIATTSGSVRSTTSSSSSIQQQHQSSFNEHGDIFDFSKFIILYSYTGSIDFHQHTPTRSSLLNYSHDDYSPATGAFVHSPITVLQSLTSPRQNTSNTTEHHRN